MTSTKPFLAGDASSLINISVHLSPSFPKLSEEKKTVLELKMFAHPAFQKEMYIESRQYNHVSVGYSHRGDLMKISTVSSAS